MIKVDVITEAKMELAFAIREEVFVVEQQVDREEEYDEFETISRHVLARDESGNPVGTARWRFTENGIKLERFAVLKNSRGTGVGSALVAAVLKDIAESPDTSGKKLYMHAQVEAIPLYEKFGFKKVGEMFEECNIKHYTMEK